MLEELNADRALIFRITHIRNVPWALANGLHCRNSQEIDRGFVTIGNPDIIVQRDTRTVPIPPGGPLSDYVPFYFTPLSPMMYNIVTGWRDIQMHPNSDIAIMVSSLRDIADARIVAVYTDRHASLGMAKFFSSLDDLDQIDWDLLQRRDFQRDPDDPGKVERYQAEALIHRHLPIQHLTGIVCYDGKSRAIVERARDALGLDVKIAEHRRWYFG